jgi:hypothetical protein
MNDTAAPAAETSPTPPPAPLSAEARAFRFWLCRLPWVVFGVGVILFLLNAVMGDPSNKNFATPLEALIDQVYGILAFMVAMPLIGYIRLSWRVLTKLSTLSTSQMRLIAWTSSVRVVWLSWPQWLVYYVVINSSFHFSFKDLASSMIFLTSIIGTYILGITGLVTFIFSTAWELELLLRRLFRRRG